MTRRRVSLRESFRRAYADGGPEGPGVEGGATDRLVGAVLAPFVAVWFWVAGEPVEGDEAAPRSS